MEMDPLAMVLFPRPPPSYGLDSFPGELIWVPRSLNPQTSSPEDCIPLCLLQCKSARYLVIYIHSNFEDLGRCHSFCMALRRHLQVHVLAVEYPSYGVSPGTSCDEQGATESAHVALRFAHEVLRWPWDSIILLGRSIGTGPATALAAKHRFGGLVLVCPFLSVRELLREYVGAAAFLLRERFPNKELIATVRAPCLFVHGEKDAMVPARHGRQLHELCAARKQLVSPPEMEHNSDLLEDESYLIGPMREFFALPGVKAMEMQVPSWAFDEQLCPKFGAWLRPPPLQQRVACSLLGATCTCPGSACNWANSSSCRQCGSCGGGMKLVSVEPVVQSSASRRKGQSFDWFVEETIMDAVEYSLERQETTPFHEQSGSELDPDAAGAAGAASVPELLANDPVFSRRMEKLLQRAEEVAGGQAELAAISARERRSRLHSAAGALALAAGPAARPRVAAMPIFGDHPARAGRGFVRV